MPSLRALTAGILMTLASVVGAQVTETPVAFDSTGRIRILTPSLVTRLDLESPQWPAAGAFREARIYSVSSGGTVLVVERANGTLDRYPLDADATAALRAAVDAAVSRVGAVVAEPGADEESQSARGHFMRRQLGLAWTLYGPLLASLSDDARISSAVVLLSVPASFYVVNRVSRNVAITRAQSALAFDGAIRGYFFGTGSLYVLAGEDPDPKVTRIVGLGSALTASIAAFRRGATMTDGEAEATTSMSNLTALTAFGTMGAAGLVDNGDARTIIGVVLAAGAGGYIIGPRYARQPGYSATRGDVQLLGLGGTLGVMTALTPLMWSDLSHARAATSFGLATAGLLAGTYAAHRVWTVPYDHTTGDATVTGLGATAGGLAGGGLAILLDARDAGGTWTMVTAGAILGGIAGHRAANPPRTGTASRSPAPADRSPALSFNVTSLAAAAAGVRGTHALISLRF